MTAKIDIDRKPVAEFCRRNHIRKLSLFGSVLRDDFNPESDVDVLVEFRPEASISLFDLAAMKDELEEIFGRKVDLVEAAALRNPFRRNAILRDAEVLYAA